MKKNLFIVFACLGLGIGLVSCEKGIENLTSGQDARNVKTEQQHRLTYSDPKNADEVIALKLDERFGIPDVIYVEFISSLTFYNETFRGAIYDEIENFFGEDSESSDEFWGHFGISLRSNSPTVGDIAMERYIYMGYKPKRGGCRSNSRWICTLVGDLGN